MSALFLQNQLLIWGLLAVSVPILIHLLTKRRFKVVHWAAMQFLLEASKQNRQRVRLEDLLLLLLRVLAVILLTLIIGRLAISPSDMSMPAGLVQIEHVFVLDDSPSMQFTAADSPSQLTGRPLFGVARDHIIQKLSYLRKEKPGDRFSLYLVSDPENPIWSRQTLNSIGLEDVKSKLESLKPTDMPALYQQVFDNLSGTFTSDASANRIAYIYTDFRITDWTDQSLSKPDPEAIEKLKTKLDLLETADNESKTDYGVIQSLEQLATQVSEIQIHPVTRNSAIYRPNLAIQSIRPLDHNLIKGVTTTFEITVVNTGDKVAEENTSVQIQLVSNESENQAQTDASWKANDLLQLNLPAIDGGKVYKTTFDIKLGEQSSLQLMARINQGEDTADNKLHYYSDEILSGSPVLIVDGSFSADALESQTVFLERALNPPQFQSNDALSGFNTERVSEAAFETLNLNDYQLIILSNLYRISPQKQEALYKWVVEGGGLIIFPGDAVDPESYNLLAEGEHAILPARLEYPVGDENKENWMLLNFSDAAHPCTRIMKAQEISPLVRMVKIFKAWHTSPIKPVAAEKKEEEKSPVPSSTLIYLDNDKESPLLYEKDLGSGYVAMFTTACDDNWSNWPGNPTYNILLLELASHLRKKSLNKYAYFPGHQISQPVDMNRYMVNGQPEISHLRNTSGTLSPDPIGASLESSANAITVYSNQLNKTGLYLLPLSSRADNSAHLLSYHVNWPLAEQFEDVMQANWLGDMVQASNISVVESSEEVITAGSLGVELWPYLLTLLLIVLILEQLLGWLFGKRRTSS